MSLTQSWYLPSLNANTAPMISSPNTDSVMCDVVLAMSLSARKDCDGAASYASSQRRAQSCNPGSPLVEIGHPSYVSEVVSFDLRVWG